MSYNPRQAAIKAALKKKGGTAGGRPVVTPKGGPAGGRPNVNSNAIDKLRGLDRAAFVHRRNALRKQQKTSPQANQMLSQHTALGLHRAGGGNNYLAKNGDPYRRTGKGPNSRFERNEVNAGFALGKSHAAYGLHRTGPNSYVDKQGNPYKRTKTGFVRDEIQLFGKGS